MNIFALSTDPINAAQQMLDKHIVKMPTETCQMLHTNVLYKQFVHEHGREPKLAELKDFHARTGSYLMKPAMLNHPSTQWARDSEDNFTWLYHHGIALCKEYTLRYQNRVHRTEKRIRDIEEYVKGDSSKASPVWIAMDDKYRLDGVQYFKDNPNATDWDFVIASYRHYYLEGKWEFATWKPVRGEPEWWPKHHAILKYNEKTTAFNKKWNANFKLKEVPE
jgi:hypothetical protein